MQRATIEHPAFYACGPHVLWRGVFQSENDVQHFIALFKDACEAAFRAGDLVAYDQACRQLNQLRDARDAARAWADRKILQRQAA